MNGGILYCHTHQDTASCMLTLGPNTTGFPFHEPSTPVVTTAAIDVVESSTPAAVFPRIDLLKAHGDTSSQDCNIIPFHYIDRNNHDFVLANVSSDCDFLCCLDEACLTRGRMVSGMY